MDGAGAVAGAGGANSDGSLHAMVASLLRLCLFTVSFAALIHLVQRYVSRTREKSHSVKPRISCEDGVTASPAAAAAPAPVFSFKFQHQIPGVLPPNEAAALPLVPAPKKEAMEEETPEVTEEAEPSPIVSSAHNYRFLTERDFRGFIEEPGAMTVLVQESYVRPESHEGAGFLTADDFRPVNEDDRCGGEASPEKDEPLERRRPSSCSLSAASSGRKEASGRMSFASEGFSGFGDSDSESSLSDGYSVRELAVDSDSDWFLSEKDFSAAADDAMSMARYKMKVLKGMQILEEAGKLQSFRDSATTESSDSMSQVTHDSRQYSDDDWSGSNSPEVESQGQEVKEEEVVTDASGGDHDDEFYSINKNSLPTCDDAAKNSAGPSEKELAVSNDHSYGVVSDAKFSSEPSETELFVNTNDQSNVVASDAKNSSDHSEKELDSTSNHSHDATRQAEASVDGKAKAEGEEEGQDKWKDLTAEEEDELESLWEHQDLIEQLKLELKKVRAIGLPTILEESETPKTPMEDLKPWRIDAKFLRDDPMDELNKFYKSYRERMRKFDILCYQKMYAIDFLQLREPLHSRGSQKNLLPTVTSILSHNFRSSSRQRSPDDPSEQFLKELRCDLETVYVGQMCLSWEFLRWQYEQARDLPDSDPYHSHQYNQVAGEFQKFQVIVQRFIEDERFQGPRLPNYVNNRCVLRNLLQVPVIKEDSLKDRMEDQRKGNYVVTSDNLEDIMEESMRILWEFIKADRVETSVLKGLTSAHVELQEPSDHELLMQIQAILQKKEKRLKDLLRTGNCLVKKFKKPREDRSNRDLFFSQVDMRLVSRVLRMPRITGEQLQWCHLKLDKITFIDRKIHREPSFLLFPC